MSGLCGLGYGDALLASLNIMLHHSASDVKSLREDGLATGAHGVQFAASEGQRISWHQHTSGGRQAMSTPVHKTQRQRLGEELRRLRDLSGLTGRQLAEAVGVNQSTVSRIES